jgi:hypothetical protein
MKYYLEACANYKWIESQYVIIIIIIIIIYLFIYLPSLCGAVITCETSKSEIN